MLEEFREVVAGHPILPEGGEVVGVMVSVIALLSIISF
jgi:hypothetical protein